MKNRKTRMYLLGWRKQHNLSQTALAERMGVSLPVYRAIENGTLKRGLTVENVSTLASVLSMSPDEVLNMELENTRMLSQW